MTDKKTITGFLTNKVFLIALLVKIISGTLFASHHLLDNFIPFVKYFISSGFHNPWDYFYAAGNFNAFPYPPLTLVIISIPYWITSVFMPGHMLNAVCFLDLFLARIPILLADLSIYLILASWFKDNYKKVLWLYWCSPVIFYINYYHGQLDSIPTALFLFSANLLFLKRYYISGIVLALALASKEHLFIIIPFYLIYCWRQNLSARKILLLCVLIIGVYFAFTGYTLNSAGYQHMVIKASEQGKIFILRLPYNLNSVDLNFLLAPAILFILLMQFMAYKKLNRDMAILYFGLIFVVLVILVSPMPGWYYWSYPFLIYFFIRSTNISKVPLIVFNVAYLFYFLTYKNSDVFEAWKLINTSIASWQVPVEMFRTYGFGKRVVGDLVFTLLQSSVIMVAYLIYKEGILSNDIYKAKKRPTMIGIGGDSGAGKDTTVNCLKNILGKNSCVIVSGDDYHKWPRAHQEWQVYTPLNTYGNKLHDQLRDAVALKDGKSIVKVTYDHNSGQFTNPQNVDSGNVVFFVGLHPFYIEGMRRLYDIKIYVEPDEVLRKYWKILRDTKDRSYTTGQVIDQLKKREEDSARFIHPQRQFADMVIKFIPLSNIDLKHVDLKKEVDLKLRVSINNSVFLEHCIQALKEATALDVQFWHEPDLKHQTIEVNGKISAIKVNDAAKRIIPNLYELISNDCVWMDDYFGILQLVFLVYLSEVSKYEDRQAVRS